MAAEDWGAMRPTLRELLETAVIGLCMGTANAVPGVSAGTVALIAGIYGRLIAAITAFTPGRAIEAIQALVPVDGTIDRGTIVRLLREIDLAFLIALGTGIATALLALNRVVVWADESVPVLLFGVFFGLIGASAVVLLRELRPRSGMEWVLGAIGVAIALWLSGQPAVVTGEGLPYLFVAGMLAVSAMILPGLSGSLMLVIIGQYAHMQAVLRTFVDGVIGYAIGEGSLAALPKVVTFVTGGVVGLVTISRVIRAALRRNRRATLLVLIGLVVGALRAPIATLSGRSAVAWTSPTIGAFLASALVGAVVVFAIDHYAVDLDLDAGV
ncbi:MAG: DUF368 domain-containing protein [Halococcoides sp.]